MSVPSEFICPISQDVMNDPVITIDGVTYDKTNLETWFSICVRDGKPRTLPATNMIVNDPISMIPNRALKSQIETFKNPGVRRDEPLADDGRRALHVCVVMDISGSMSNTATRRNESNETETLAYSVLDLVKYATKTVSRMLGPRDRFSLVTFHSESDIVLNGIGGGTQESFSIIDTALGRVCTAGMTALGSGIRSGLNVLRDHNDEDCINVLMALTDGMPNCDPPAIDVLASYKNTHADFMGNTVVNTYAFGMGPDIASNQMHTIASMGNGMYSYIPDISFLGTVFIHTMANMRCLTSINPKATIGNEGNQELSGELTRLESSRSVSDFQVIVDKYAADEAITYDLESQVEIAIQNPHYHKWGKHYLLSLVSAHSMGMCNNFKDHSVAVYKTPNVAECYDKYEDIFNLMEPPKPTRQQGAALLHCSVINNCFAPCVHENTLIHMKDGTQTRAKNIKPGVQVVLYGGGHGTVTHVIKTQTLNGHGVFVNLPGGLRITEWHPVMLCNKWVFPKETPHPKEISATSHVYSYAIKTEKAVKIPAMFGNGIPFVYLGHGNQDSSSLINHEFFGSQKCLEGLDPVTEFKPFPALRDPATQKVNCWDMDKIVRKPSGLLDTIINYLWYG